jgi:hypothetical protein
MVKVATIKCVGSNIYMKKFRTQKQTTKLHYFLLNKTNDLGRAIKFLLLKLGLNTATSVKRKASL